MVDPRPTPIASAPGVKRDGTRFEGDNYVDAQWCRWQRGLPRKIGGYRAISRYLQGIARALLSYTSNTQTYIHAGSANAVERFYVDNSGNTSVISDRTPTTLTADDLNMWQFDSLADSASGVNTIVAQCAPNLDSVSSSGAGQLFAGDMFATTPLVEVSTVPANWDPSGGVVVLHPYCFVFGNNGYVAWSIPGDPTDFTGSGAGNAYITGQKIVFGLTFRGGPGNSPSGLFWSADSLLRASYIGGTPVFQFDTISDKLSILGAQTVIEYDGIFYWVADDRFLMFNGVVREVENRLNINWFFDNVNRSQSQKVFAMKVPRYGEIWWCFPFGDATECTHAVIYNIRENTWYDTILPNGGRAAALSSVLAGRPIMSGVEPQKFIAVDAAIVDGGTGYAIGDTLSIIGGLSDIAVELTVSAEVGSVITGVSISNAGSYTVEPTNPVSTTTSGLGVDATFDLTFLAPYRLWIHESGVNEIVDQNEQPVLSYFETADICLAVTDGLNNQAMVTVLEPDFVQSGDMTVVATGRANARSVEVETESRTIAAIPATPAEQVVYFNTQRRQLRFRFASNAMGGDYQMGMPLVHLQPGDETLLGGLAE